MVSNATWHSEFAYDGLSRRIEMREYANGSLASVKRHVYDGWFPVAELNETNGLVSTMTWGLDLSLSFEGAGGVGGLLSLTRHSTPDTLFYFYDGSGNMVDVLDDSDTLAAHYEYDPFGNVLVADGPHADHPFQWSTKMRHEPSGLVYYGYRFLKPDIGRWLSRDPIEEWGGVNLYGFVGNAPVTIADILGMIGVGPFVPVADSIVGTACCGLDGATGQHLIAWRFGSCYLEYKATPWHTPHDSTPLPISVLQFIIGYFSGLPAGIDPVSLTRYTYRSDIEGTIAYFTTYRYENVACSGCRWNYQSPMWSHDSFKTSEWSGILVHDAFQARRYHLQYITLDGQGGSRWSNLPTIPDVTNPFLCPSFSD